MRVLHAAHFYGTTAGGFVPLVAALARRLRARGDAFALVVPRVDGASWYAQVRAAGAELHVVDDTADAIRLIRAWRPDVVHLHFYGWEIPLTLGLWTLRARLFWHAHSVYRWDRPLRPSLRTVAKYRLLGARVERFVAVSQAVGAELVHVGAPRRRVVAVPNAVDAGRFAPPSAAERATARAALGLGAARTILFFGRNPRLKGADVLADALAGVPDATVVTVATPADARAALARHARVVALDHVDDVVPLLWAADALAVPSRGEGFGLVLLEAAQTGLPVAASDLPALREAGAAHAAVRYAPVGDATALAGALRTALALPHGLAAPPNTAAAPPAQHDPLAHWAAAITALYDDPL